MLHVKIDWGMRVKNRGKTIRSRPGRGAVHSAATCSRPAAIAWFAAHELRLSWRDWLAMTTAGQRWRERNVAIALVLFGAFLHLIRIATVPFANGCARLRLRG